MTLEERSRAKKLEKLSQAYVKSLPQKIVIPIMLAVMAVLFSIMFATGGGEVVPAMHVMFSGILLIGYSNGIIGDRDTVIDTRVYGTQISGSMYTGPFLCTLPFKAKDLLALRIREFEINIAAINISAVVIHIILMLTGSAFGLCVALTAFLEAGFLIMIFVRRFNNKFFWELLIFVIVMTLAIESIDSEGTTTEIYNAFDFLSGWLGIAVL
ncbi:MAG: hypothetical protein K2N71_12210, partial [Oscillospiraceae bacterium]|nr:hypothetical protein [Oscillospiraceae bacterium]